MPVDARPFLLFVTAQGSIRCGHPKVAPLAYGLTGGGGSRPIQESYTHTIKVYPALGTPPADLQDGVRGTVDGQAYEVLKNGISKGPGTWTLFVRATRALVPA